MTTNGLRSIQCNRLDELPNSITESCSEINSLVLLPEIILRYFSREPHFQSQLTGSFLSLCKQTAVKATFKEDIGAQFNNYRLSSILNKRFNVSKNSAYYHFPFSFKSQLHPSYHGSVT